MTNVKAKVKKIQILSSRSSHSVPFILLIHHVWLHGVLIKICENIELNSAPKQKQDQFFSIFRWNLNSIPAHIFQKLKVF